MDLPAKTTNDWNGPKPTRMVPGSVTSTVTASSLSYIGFLLMPQMRPGFSIMSTASQAVALVAGASCAISSSV